MSGAQGPLAVRGARVAQGPYSNIIVGCFPCPGIHNPRT